MFGNLVPWKKRHDDVKVRNEYDAIARLRQDFDQLWDRFRDDWRSGDLSLWGDSRWPGSRVAFDDLGREYVLRAELPGYEPEEFDVNVSGNVLTLRAKHQEESKNQNGDASYRRYQSLHESFTLPTGVLADQIDARYHSGVLEIHLPKSGDCQTKRIAVKCD